MRTFNPKPKPEPRPRKTPKPIKARPKLEKRTMPQNAHISLEHILDDLCSKYVIKRDGKCVTCGARDGLTCSHYIDRKYMLIRWDEDNTNCQCAECNGKHDNFKQPYKAYLTSKIGEKRVAWLEGEGKIVYKWPEYQLLQLVKEFKFKIKELDHES